MTNIVPLNVPTGPLAPAPRERLFICVCTCQRPKMLDDCLNSLCELVRPDDIDISVVVVDNDEAGSAMGVVAGYAQAAPFLVLYHHEPRRGIAFAR